MFLKEEILGSVPLFIWPTRVQVFKRFIVKYFILGLKKFFLLWFIPIFSLYVLKMRSSRTVRAQRLAVNAKVATVLGLIPASSDTVESERRQMKKRWIHIIKKIQKISPKSPSHRDFMVQKSRKSERSKILHLGTFNVLKLYVLYSMRMWSTKHRLNSRSLKTTCQQFCGKPNAFFYCQVSVWSCTAVRNIILHFSKKVYNPLKGQ